MSEENIVDDNHGFKEEVEYAGFWIRVGAGLIDILVMIPIFAVSYFNQFDIKSLALLYILTIISVMYKPLLEFKYGATLGKMAVGIKVVNLEMQRITLDQAFGRYIPWAISVVIQLMIGTSLFLAPKFSSADTYLEIQAITQDSPLNMISGIYSLVFVLLICWLIFDKKNQGIHDKIAKTLCIKIKK
jgi:uncharacterized RDD family membrane protein YckC